MKQITILLLLIIPILGIGQTLNVFDGSGVKTIVVSPKTGSTIWVNSLNDFPQPVGNTIHLLQDATYQIARKIDLQGNKIECHGINTIVGSSSETQSLFSTGLDTSQFLIVSDSSVIIKDITISHHKSFCLITNGSEQVLDWVGVNVVGSNCAELKGYQNINFSRCAFLASNNFKLGGTINTFSLNYSLMTSGSGSIFYFDNTFNCTRRVRIGYSSFVCTGGSVIDFNGIVPNSQFIIQNCNFSGGGNYLVGINSNSIQAKFENNAGIFNTPFFTGTTSQYIRGDGTLATTPTGESTTVTDSPIVDFTLTGTGITATIVDGSITPAKLSQTYLVSEVDGSTTNELQTMSIVGNNLALTNGGSVDLGFLLDNTDGQSLSLSGTTLSISGGSSTSFAGWDFNATDDFSGAWASLTGVPAGFLDGVDNGIVTETDPTVTEALVDGFISNNGYLTTEIDGSVTNEIQNLSLAGQALSITGATGVTLPVVGITAGAGIVSTPTSGNYTISQVLEQRAITTATQASTVVTATNITGLGLPILAGKKYQFEAWLPYSSAALTTGIALAHTAVTGNTWHTVSAQSTTTATQERRFLNNSLLFVSTASAATTGSVAYMEGRIEPTANTTFQLQFATEVAGSVITLQPGCILIVKEVF